MFIDYWCEEIAPAPEERNVLTRSYEEEIQPQEVVSTASIV
jgi:hypothetical protein